MKKFLIMLLALTMVMAMAMPAAAATITETTEDKTTSVEVTTEVPVMYTVTIPADVTIEFEATSVKLPAVTMSNYHLESGAYINVKVEADSAFLKLTDGAGTIPFTLTNKSWTLRAGSGGDTVTANSQCTISIAESAWKSAAAGTYSATLTFTVEYATTPVVVPPTGEVIPTPDPMSPQN